MTILGDAPGPDRPGKMLQELKIIQYPDPRLKKLSVEVTAFDDRLKALAARMLELMREEKGVGLAAPQVGENIRLFVMNHTGEPGGDRAYVNPVLSDPSGEEEAEEGCLSLPEIRADILRSKTMRIDAQDLDGRPFHDVQSGFVARVWQHETDHLNGTLILDRMGPVAKMAAKRILKDLEEQFAKHQQRQKTKSPSKPML
jgi:peptide deformylase